MDQVYDGEVDCFRDGSDENEYARDMILRQLFPDGGIPILCIAPFTVVPPITSITFTDLKLGVLKTRFLHSQVIFCVTEEPKEFLF